MSTLFPDLISSFPDSVDSFPTWFNIVATDGPLIQQYQSALQAGNTTLANQILAQIPQGTQKIIKASDLNLITSAMLAMERFYKDNIADYVRDKQAEWLSVINQFSYKGTWSTGTSYQVNNLVTYTTSGIAFVYLATSTPPVGTVPTNTQYWRLLTIQGQPGPSGAGLSYRQEWNVSTQYQINDAVTYDGTIWMSLQSNTGIQPGTNQSIWKQIITLETAAYPIQPTEPQGLQQGDLWFNTQGNPTSYIYEGDINTFLDKVNGEVVGTTLEEKEQRLLDTKNAIKESIISKNVEILDSDTFYEYANKISEIVTGNTKLADVQILSGGSQGELTYIDQSGMKNNIMVDDSQPVTTLKVPLYSPLLFTTSSISDPTPSSNIVLINMVEDAMRNKYYLFYVKGTGNIIP